MPFAAKEGDQVTATDNHLILTPAPATVMVPHPFTGILNGSLSGDVLIEGKGAATVDSTGANTPPHIPIGGSFVNPPSNQAQIIMGSGTVKINGKAAARNGDTALTCNDPVDAPVGTVVVPFSTVSIGG